MGEMWWMVMVLVVLSLLMGTVVKVVDLLWWRPRRMEKHFSKQGIRGPSYRFLFGNVMEMVALMLDSNSSSTKPMVAAVVANPHNILPRVLSFYTYWKKIYGSTFLLWFGPTPRLAVAEPDLIRDILVSQASSFDRYESHPLVRQLEGEGLVSLRGEKWAHRRRVLSPTFHLDNLNLIIPMIGKTVVDMVAKWETISPSSEEVEIDVSEWFQGVTEDAITRTAFGRSYDGGKAVFQLQAQQMVFAAEAFRKVFIPGYRFLPTEKNMATWKLDKEIKKNLMTLIGRRKEAGGGENKTEAGAKDLLGLMIDESATTKKRRKNHSHTHSSLLSSLAPADAAIPISDIVEECKTFFFAGKQTSSNLLTWTTVLLAMHPEWQERARDEVIEVFCGCSSDIPTKDQLAKLKTLGMIINETLRLYPPAVAVIRRAKADVRLGEYDIPLGTELLIPIMAVHHDERLWGADVTQFNPSRFADGAVRAARHPNAFLPFGMGARTCIGQNLAVLEAKLAIAIILRRFSFRLSPSYVHAPTVLMLLYPKYGAPVLFRSLSGSSSEKYHCHSTS